MKNKAIKSINDLSKFMSLLIFPILVGVFLLSNPVIASEINPLNINQLSNKLRQIENLKPLISNQLLGKAANEKAKSIFSEQIFAHNFTDRKFSDWVKDTGYEYYYVGENLAIDFREAEDVIKAWKESPTHLANILNPKYQEIGISVLDGKIDGKESKVIVQIFGTQKENIYTGLLTSINQANFKDQTQANPVNKINYISSSYSSNTLSKQNLPNINLPSHHYKNIKVLNLSLFKNLSITIYILLFFVNIWVFKQSQNTKT